MSSLLLATVIAGLLGDSTGCRKAPQTDPAALLHRAAAIIGLPRSEDTVLSAGAFDVTSHAYESDRMYPPVLVDVSRQEQWFDPITGVERITSQGTLGGGGFRLATMGGARASYVLRDTTLIPSDAVHGMLYATRPLSVWAVLTDWLAASARHDVRIDGLCVYRDYPRLVLSRQGAQGVERLFLDPKSGYPTKLDRIEPHYLWGQVHVEFVYSTWQRVGGAHFPAASFRMEDGTTVVTRTYGERRLVARDSAPSLAVPRRDGSMTIGTPGFLLPTRPDTVRVSASTFILRNRGYGETVTLARDTVFVFDAVQGEARVRQDSAWIGTLFPGHHPIVVVVTDLAWPHIAGVRAWVAYGATIVSHQAARSFLDSVVNRRWTLSPDLLERRRATARFRFRAVRDSLPLAGGDILLFPIDGAASEVALAGFLRADRFLWASDFIQTLSRPTQYLDEVLAAVTRVGVSPLRVAAEHLSLAPWERAAALADPPPPRRP